MRTPIKFERYEDVDCMTASVVSAFEISQMIIYAATLVVYVVLFYLIIRHSGPAIDKYRFYILGNATAPLIGGLLTACFAPHAYSAHYVFVFRGLGSLFEVGRCVCKMTISIIMIMFRSLIF